MPQAATRPPIYARLYAQALVGILISGIATRGDIKDLGRIGIKTLLYFEVITTPCPGIALIVVNVLQPGAGINADPAALDPSAVAAYATSAQQLGLALLHLGDKGRPLLSFVSLPKYSSES